MAPNSMKELKKRELKEWMLQKKIKKLSVLQNKLKTYSKVIKLKSISLGNLKNRSLYKQISLKAWYRKSWDKRISLKQKELLFIHGLDEGLLIAGIPSDNTECIRKLDKSIEALKRKKSKCQSKGKNRGNMRNEYWLYGAPIEKNLFILMITDWKMGVKEVH